MFILFIMKSYYFIMFDPSIKDISHIITVRCHLHLHNINPYSILIQQFQDKPISVSSVHHLTFPVCFYPVVFSHLQSHPREHLIFPGSTFQKTNFYCIYNYPSTYLYIMDDIVNNMYIIFQ